MRNHPISSRPAASPSRIGTLLGAVLGLLVLPSAGHAFVRCVTTSQGLTNALADAVSTADQTTEIKIAAGTYTSATGFSMILNGPSIQAVTISGGWSSPSCASKLWGPSVATVLVGPPAYQTLTVATKVGAQVNNIHLADLTLSHPGYSGNQFGACFRGNNNSATHILTLERVRIEQCDATHDDGVYLSSAGASYLRNLVVKNNTVPAPVRVSAGWGGTIAITQLTLLHEADQFGLDLLAFGSGSQIFLSNSVVRANGGTGAPWSDIRATRSSGGGIGLERVHYDVLDGSASYSIAPSSGDPGFVSATDPHLRDDSVLVDSGVPNPTGNAGTLDADGKARVFGAAVDVGAFEYVPDALFVDGFETGP